MKNKISIDEMVRQKVAHGEEPHNLSAWANMERMLDGKNPYSEEDEDEKSRPWLFMFLAVALLSSSIAGGYLYFSNSQTVATQAKTAALSPSTTVNTTETPTTTASKPRKEQSAESKNSANQSINNQTETQYASTNQDATLAAIVDNDKQNTLDAIKNDSPGSAKQTTDNTRPNGNRTNLNLGNTAPSMPNAVASIDKNRNRDIGKSLDQLNRDPLKIADNSPVFTTANGDQIPAFIEVTDNDTAKVLEITNRTKRNAYGEDVMGKDTNTTVLVQQRKRIVVNPRFVELTREQEEAAQRRTLVASNDKNSTISVPPSFSKPKSVAPKSNATPDASVGLSKSHKKKKGFLSLFKEVYQKANQKAINMANTKYPIYTGMFVGVNAALVNTQHNFGGFQGGFTAMTPLSRILSLTTEARFIHKNNSGYTITDHQSRILNTNVDVTSWTKGKIYTYDIDSVTTGHNLDNFYSMQIPVTLTAHVKKFDLYGGIHLNYGFRMNVNSSQKSNPLTVVDSVNYATSYAERVNTNPQFNRDDFSSRLGLGYTVGGAYNFTNKLYVDLRMSNLFWDNTKGAAKKEISDVFFRLPSFQLSLGYRFRQFDREE